jgi:hypothetical protein
MSGDNAMWLRPQALSQEQLPTCQWHENRHPRTEILWKGPYTTKRAPPVQRQKIGSAHDVSNHCLLSADKYSKFPSSSRHGQQINPCTLFDAPLPAPALLLAPLLEFLLFHHF